MQLSTREFVIFLIGVGCGLVMALTAYLARNSAPPPEDKPPR